MRVSVTITAVTSAIFLLAAAITAVAAGRTVARVTDLQGDARVRVDGDDKALAILARVRQGATIELANGARLTLHFPVNRTDIKLVGPASVDVKADTAVSNNGLTTTKEHSDIGISVDLSDSDLGAIVARGIKTGGYTPSLKSPVDSEVIVGRPLEFVWSSSASGMSFQLDLRDEAGTQIFTATSLSTAMVLPKTVKLKPDTAYTWSVKTVSGGQSVSSKTGEFRTADTQEMTRYYELALTSKEEVSDLVLYALLLEELELKTEAGKVWQHLESYRPGISELSP